MPLLLHGALLAAGGAGVSHGRLFDPDSYMRLVRVGELMAAGDWFSDAVPRSNAPFGSTISWSRPFDVLILVGALLGRLVTDGRAALFWSGALVSPVLNALALGLLAWAGRGLLGRSTVLLAAVLFLAQSGLYSFFRLGRADHHSLQIVLVLALVALLIHGFATGKRAWFAGAGLTGALAVWVSTEALIGVLVALVALGLRWLRDDRRTLTELGWFTGALAGGIAVALGVERGRWLVVDYDKIALVHLALAGAMAAAVGLGRALERRGRLDGRPARLVFAAVAIAVLAAALRVVFPGFFAGPFGNVADEVTGLLMRDVSELKPLWPTDAESSARLFFFLGPLGIALPYAALKAWRGGDGWLPLAVGMAVYTPFALVHLRVAPFVEALFVLPWAAVIADLMPRVGMPRAAVLGRFALATLALVWHVGVAAAFAGPGARNLTRIGDPCPWDALAPVLNRERPAADRPIILTHVYPGSELLWRTYYDVVSAPYHDDRDGMADTLTVFAATDDDAARAVIDRRGVGLVIVCRILAGADAGAWAPITASPQTLYNRLLRGEPPAWLASLPLPADLSDIFAVYARTP
ncbi:MAG: hypothetical protein EXQ94_14515 [Alphaproteobacteria bacterium]|nr:hypothetical protein [Alphaproteobacteria bacterium]